MTCQFIIPASHSLAVVLLGMHCTMASAEIYDITELQQPDNSSAAMTGFFTVTPDGKTTREDPVKSGFAISAGSDFDPERASEKAPDTDASGQNPEQASRSEKKARKKRTVRIRVKRKPPEQNLANQFQCERHGFYYTDDGRCILPTYQHYIPAIPQPLPRGGMRPMMLD
ncbi:MAG: hypothetical protein ABFS24_09815 [Pseudomonadota bacterium]